MAVTSFDRESVPPLAAPWWSPWHLGCSGGPLLPHGDDGIPCLLDSELLLARRRVVIHLPGLGLLVGRPLPGVKTGIVVHVDVVHVRPGRRCWYLLSALRDAGHHHSFTSLGIVGLDVPEQGVRVSRVAGRGGGETIEGGEAARVKSGRVPGVEEFAWLAVRVVHLRGELLHPLQLPVEAGHQVGELPGRLVHDLGHGLSIAGSRIRPQRTHSSSERWFWSRWCAAAR